VAGLEIGDRANNASSSSRLRWTLARSGGFGSGTKTLEVFRDSPVTP
jgi:hypothetical protein